MPDDKKRTKSIYTPISILCIWVHSIVYTHYPSINRFFGTDNAAYLGTWYKWLNKTKGKVTNVTNLTQLGTQRFAGLSIAVI